MFAVSYRDKQMVASRKLQIRAIRSHQTHKLLAEGSGETEEMTKITLFTSNGTFDSYEGEREMSLVNT